MLSTAWAGVAVSVRQACSLRVTPNFPWLLNSDILMHFLIHLKIARMYHQPVLLHGGCPASSIRCAGVAK